MSVLTKLPLLLMNLCFLSSVLPDAYARSTPSSLPQQNSSSEDLSHMLERSTALPVALRAELELRIIESGHLPRATPVNRYLVDLLANINDIPDKFPTRSVDFGPDSLEKETQKASSLYRLDRLSIELKIIAALHQRNPVEATRAIDALQVNPSPTSCDQTLIPSLTYYYAYIPIIAGYLVPQSGHPITTKSAWIEAQVHSLDSPLKIAGVAHLIATTSEGPRTLEERSTYFNAMLVRLPVTDRELLSIISDGSLSKGLTELLNIYRIKNISTIPLVESFRQFLLNSRATPSCADYRTSPESVIALFRAVRNTAAVSVSTVPDLSLDDFKDRQTGSVHASVHEIKSYTALEPDLIALYKLYMIHAPASDLAWQEYLDTFIQHVDALNLASNECQECVYLGKVRALTDAFDFAPVGFSKEALLERLVNTLADNPVEREMPSLWIYQVQLILNLARPVAQKQEVQLQRLIGTGNAVPLLPSPIASQIRDTMERSSDIALFLYTRTDELLGTTFDAPYLRGRQ
ncbi:MAG: hypothetical protein ACYCSN_09255 [Acidobacteriaceae bacterium]